MQNQATLLYHLQLVDQDIARHRARLTEIDAKLNGDKSVMQATRQLSDAQEALKPVQVHARALDLEIKSVADKAKTADANLYSGRITSPKALQELQDEIDSLKRRQTQLENEMLETMMTVEANQGTVAGAEEALTQVRTAFASEQTDLREEQGRLAVELPQLEQKRADMALGVEPGNLAAYDKLRQRMRGQAVARMVEEGCTICGVEQNSMTVQKVRLGRSLVFCESCGRILADIS